MKFDICPDCREKRTLPFKGLCQRCYHKQWRDNKRPNIKRKLEADLATKEKDLAACHEAYDLAIQERDAFRQELSRLKNLVESTGATIERADGEKCPNCIDGHYYKTIDYCKCGYERRR